MVHINCSEPLRKPMWILKTAGLWPLGAITKFVALKYLGNLIYDIVFLYIVLHNIVNAVVTKNINLLNWMTCVFMPLINYYAKIIALFAHKKYLISILDDISGDVFNRHSEKLNRHIQSILRISNIIIRYFAFVLTSFISAFGLLPFVTNTRPLIPAPFDVGKYETVYNIAHLFACIFIGTASTGLDVFFMSLMTLCAAQLDILEEMLTNIWADANEAFTDPLLKKRFATIHDVVQHTLSECVILHETINRFVSKLSILLSFPLCVQYGIGSFLICNTILQLTILSSPDSTNIIGLCGYSGVVFAQVAVYHWLGNEIFYKSNKIMEAAYLSEWYKLDTKSQRCLVLLMERAKRSLVITIYKVIFISLESLVQIIRWSYSVFALIKARYN